MANSLTRHLRLYRYLIKFSAILETEYRFSFFLEVFVEVAFFCVTLVSMLVLFSNVTEVAGWEKPEMMVLYGINMVFSEIMLGTAFIHNLRELPLRIAKGELDVILTKPVNSLFAVSLWRPYFAAIPSAAVGLLVAILGFIQGNLRFDPLYLIPFIFLYSCGMVIAYSIGVIISSLSFWFINADPLPFLAQQFLFLAKHPFDIYSGIWRIVFFAIIPTAFMVSFPVQALLGQWRWPWFIAAIALVGIFMLASRWVWQKGLKAYESAST